MRFERLVGILVATIAFQSVFSQFQTIEENWLLPEYNSFINADTIELVKPEGYSDFFTNRFLEKYDSILTNKNRQINIIHIGGSHIQAGVFSDRIREHLWQQGDFSTARGFVFPFKIGKTNNPRSYTVSHRGEWQWERCVGRKNEVQLGMGGFAVYTSDPEAEITIRVDDNNGFDRIKVLGYVDDGSDWAVLPTVKLHSKRVVYPEYDYVDKGVYTLNLREKHKEFKIYFQQSDSVVHRFVLTGFLLENDDAGVVYHAIGVNGAAVPSYLKCERFEAELSEICPDMVIFGIGINDAVVKDFSTDTFKQNYNTLIETIRRVSPECLFVFITNNDSYRKIGRKRYAVNTNGLLVQEAMYQLAKENGGLVFDQFQIMGGLRSMREWSEAGLGKKDRIHFTEKGYNMLGDMFFKAFYDFYEKHKNR